MGDDVVDLGAKLDAGDVAEAEHGAVGIGADDDGAELFGGGEAALGHDGEGEFLTGGDGAAADLAGGVDAVLRLDGGDDLGDGDAEFGELVGLDPDAHGVLAAAEGLDAGDAGEAGELVDHVDEGVVGEEDVIA